MEDTIFMAVLITVVLGAIFLALIRTQGNSEEWEREFYRSDSGGGGTPYQPFRAHQRKFVCGRCNLPFLFVTFEEGPDTEPTCPFCHAKEARQWDDGEAGEAPEPVSPSSPIKNREPSGSAGGGNRGEGSPTTNARGTNAVTDYDPWEEAWRRWAPWN